MTSKWDSDEPRSLSADEIKSIIADLRFTIKQQTPIQENLLYIHKDKTAKKLANIKIKPSKIPELKKIILQRFYSSLVAQGEAVGVNAAQCIGEPTTQSTLNSLDWHEKILILVNGEPQVVEIGAWIDSLLIKNNNGIKHFPENRTEYLEVKDVQILSPNFAGKINWDAVTAVTRHLPVGKLVYIITKTGRRVKATQSKSFLVWNGESFIQKEGSELHIGDLLPVTFKMPSLPIINMLSVQKYIHNFVEKSPEKIPEYIRLTKEFGHLIGMYLFSGSIVDNNIIIHFANDFRTHSLIKNWCEKYNVTYKLSGTNVTITSALLSELFLNWMGKHNVFRTVPIEAYANDDFAKGILYGFCSEDEMLKMEAGGTLEVNPNVTTGLASLASKFGIFTHLNNNTLEIVENVFVEAFRQHVGKLSSHLGEKKKCWLRTVKDTILDPIVHIELVDASTEYVYDLTVPATTNFCIWNGLGCADTFHHTGQSAKNVTLGFPRAKELFNATHTPSNPTCTIYFTKNNTSPSLLHKIADKIPESNVDNLLKSWQVLEPNEYTLEYWHIAWLKLHPALEISEDDWCLRLKFNVAKLYAHNLKVSEIATILEKCYDDIRCIPSPLNLGIVDVIVNCSEINMTNSRSIELANITDDWTAKEFYMTKIVSPKIRGEQICGITGITRLYYRRGKPNESFGGYPLKKEIAASISGEEEWIIDTDGTNLAQVLTVPGVDSRRTVSNDMWEIYNIFGIEAVRQYLFIEFMNIVAGGGTSINPIHIQTLVGKMTYTGGIRAIARFGVETSQYDPIARATFEEVMSQLITSAVFSERDKLKGISSNIVLGTKINAGTGAINLENIALNIIPQPQPKQMDEDDED